LSLVGTRETARPARTARATERTERQTERTERETAHFGTERHGGREGVRRASGRGWLAQVSAHHAADFCIYFEGVIVSIGPETHPVYPPISAINGGPPFHPRCVHVLTPFVERLATEEEKQAGMVPPEGLNKTLAELQRRYRKESAAIKDNMQSA